MFDYEMHRLRAEELQRQAEERRLVQQARRGRRPAAGSGDAAGARGRTARRRGSAE